MTTQKILIIAIFIVILAFVGAMVFYNFENGRLAPQNETTPTSQSSPIPTQAQNGQPAFCTQQDLQSTLTLSPGAGNIFGSITIQNTSGSLCTISGNNFVQAVFDAGNIQSDQQGQAGSEMISLAPNDTVYSQVHYPNGPQCSGPTQQSQVSFQYAISPQITVAFTTPNGSTQQSITTCTDNSEITQIDVWSLSTQPITP